MQQEKDSGVTNEFIRSLGWKDKTTKEHKIRGLLTLGDYTEMYWQGRFTLVRATGDNVWMLYRYKASADLRHKIKGYRQCLSRVGIRTQSDLLFYMNNYAIGELIEESIDR